MRTVHAAAGRRPLWFALAAANGVCCVCRPFCMVCTARRLLHVACGMLHVVCCVLSVVCFGFARCLLHTCNYVGWLNAPNGRRQPLRTHARRVARGDGSAAGGLVHHRRRCRTHSLRTDYRAMPPPHPMHCPHGAVRSSASTAPTTRRTRPPPHAACSVPHAACRTLRAAAVGSCRGMAGRGTSCTG